MQYTVQKRQSDGPLSCDWEAPCWNTGVAELTHFMGERPAYFPRTRARVMYDDQAIYILFRVDDRYVRAIAPAHQGPVWKDSCVEFFFTPDDVADCGYFNLEMNCGGTMLLHYRPAIGQRGVPLDGQDLAAIEIVTTLPQIVEPEIADAITWGLACRLPLDLIRKHWPTAREPGPGAVWRGNFYKCAEHNSHPHWLTWAPIDFPKPNFHLPKYFGAIAFA